MASLGGMRGDEEYTNKHIYAYLDVVSAMSHVMYRAIQTVQNQTGGMRTMMSNQRWNKLLFFEKDDIDFIESTLKHKNRVKKRWFPPRRRATVGNNVVVILPGD